MSFSKISIEESLSKEKKDLLIAISQGNLGTVKKLVSEGCDINFETGNAIWNTPLHLAILKRSYDIVRFLVESGASLSDDMCDDFSTHPEDLKITHYLSLKFFEQDQNIKSK